MSFSSGGPARRKEEIRSPGAKQPPNIYRFKAQNLFDIFKQTSI
jgi:hypothetical protein